jgi:hypothetical protein
MLFKSAFVKQLPYLANIAVYPKSAFRKKIAGMSRTTATFSMSLPPETAEQLEQVLKAEHASMDLNIKKRYFDDSSNPIVMVKSYCSSAPVVDPVLFFEKYVD